MTVEIREFMEAARRRQEADNAAIKRWLDGDRSKPLSPELKARWLEAIAEHDGIEAAARTMDTLATQNMPETLQ